MRPKAAQSTSLHTIASSFLEYEQTGCSWYDKLYQNYSWADKLQLRWRIRAEMTDYIWATGCSWADSQADSLNWADSKVDKWQLSWLIAPELRYDSWADIPRPMTSASWADTLQLSRQIAATLSWHIAAELTDCKPSWQIMTEQILEWTDDVIWT